MSEVALIFGIFGIALFAVAGLVYGLPIGYCAMCSHCKFKAAEKLRKQRELAHDMDHKGQGWSGNAADTRSCPDETCPRNPKRPGEPS